MTVRRYLKALERSGEKVYDESVGERGAKVWRLVPNTRIHTVHLTTAQITALSLARSHFDFLRGTGLKDDLDDVFTKLRVALTDRDRRASATLERKLLSLSGPTYASYKERTEDLDDAIHALLAGERLAVTHSSVSNSRKVFVVEPLSLVVHKAGLYLLARRVDGGHGASSADASDSVRAYGLDSFKTLTRRKGERFEYPRDFDPTKHLEGSFGIILGPEVRVRFRFTEKVAKYVRRRVWHPTQVLTSVSGGVELEMRVRGTVELVTWVLGFGRTAEVLEPASLRAEVARELRDAASYYSDV
jgi:predicted DNA-binding transcriptional regulator YafY